MERRVESTSSDERTEHLGQRDRERTRRVTTGPAEPATPRPHAEEDVFGRLRLELSEKIERECAHVDAVLSERVAGVRELPDQRINDQTRLLGAEFRQLEARITHETGALRTEIAGIKDRIEAKLAHETEALRTETAGFKDGIEARITHETEALRTEIASLKDLLLSRMEQQERVRAAEYAATKWSIRSMMAAMALLVAMMAHFTLFQ